MQSDKHDKDRHHHLQWHVEAVQNIIQRAVSQYVVSAHSTPVAGLVRGPETGYKRTVSHKKLCMSTPTYLPT